MVPELTRMKTRKCSIWKYASVWKYARLILRRLANRLIEATDWTFLHNETSIDLACDIRETKWKLWRNAFVSTKHNLPWMSSTIKAKMTKRKSVYRRARKTGSPGSDGISGRMLKSTAHSNIAPGLICFTCRLELKSMEDFICCSAP